MLRFVTAHRHIRPRLALFKAATRALSTGSSSSAPRALRVSDHPYALANALNAAGKRRGFIVTSSDGDNELVASHACLEPLADFLRDPIDCPDYLGHEACFFEVGPRSGALLGAFLWNTMRGAAGGGIRLIRYDSVASYVTDGLRLATGMGRKNALTGLWHGGGKGVIAVPDGDRHLESRAFRRAIFEDYGEFVTGLRGCYVAAEDSGVHVDDMDIVFSKSRFTTCISPELGGSGNPSVPTAAGVAMGMEGAVTFMHEQGLTADPVFDDAHPLAGKTVAIQGCGNVGRPLIGFLLEKGVERIIACDIDAENVERTRNAFSNNSNVEVKHVPPGNLDILVRHCPVILLSSLLQCQGVNTCVPFVRQAEDVDIVSPCAWGGVLNPETVPRIRPGTIVCGAANAQLLDPADDCGMTARGIVYVPDFCANPMGIVNCANEAYGRVGRLGTTEDPMISDRLGRDFEFSVFNSTRRVLGIAAERGISTAEAANELADALCEVPHPIFGHRSKAIVESLVASGWAE